MADEAASKMYCYDRQGVYRISVVGVIQPDCLDRLKGMTVEETEGSGERCVSTLVGELHNQAALFGVLRTLYDQRLPLVSVKRLEENC